MVNQTDITYRYKFQEQERQDEFGLNWDSFKYRNYDYAIGRFMSIDPLAEKYTYNSPYAFQENKMGLGRELEGLELHYSSGQEILQNTGFKKAADWWASLFTPAKSESGGTSKKNASVAFTSKNGGGENPKTTGKVDEQMNGDVVLEAAAATGSAKGGVSYKTIKDKLQLAVDAKDFTRLLSNTYDHVEGEVTMITVRRGHYTASDRAGDGRSAVSTVQVQETDTVIKQGDQALLKQMNTTDSVNTAAVAKKKNRQ